MANASTPKYLSISECPVARTAYTVTVNEPESLDLYETVYPLGFRDLYSAISFTPPGELRIWLIQWTNARLIDHDKID